MSNIVFVVEMLRYGDRESHSYIDGVYSDNVIAECNAKLHILMRAGKYCAEIRQFVVDGLSSNKVVQYISDVYEDEEDIENDLKSRQDWLKYRQKLKVNFNKQEEN